MSQRLKAIRSSVSMFACRHPRLVIMLALLVLLVAVQGSVAAGDVDCSSCVSTNDAPTSYAGPDDP